MSHHNKEIHPDHNTLEIRAELSLHGHPTNKPSMMADAFRFGYMARKNNKSRAELIHDLERVIELNLSNVEDSKAILAELKETLPCQS